MGVRIVELLERHEVMLEELSGRIIVVDAPNHLYQFLTTIRGPDGSPFKDSRGNTTSHLIGLFSRAASLMQKNLRLFFVFDGKVPELKHRELEKRKAIKKMAEEQYVRALRQGDSEQMRKFAGRFSRLTPEMIDDAKRLLGNLGIPYMDAPSEAEAQAAYIVRKSDAFAVSSQDADSFLFGAPRLIRNLSITGRRKKAGALEYSHVTPEIIVLEEVLGKLGIDRKQLIVLGMLVGTDYNPGGIKGIGPKKGLELVKKHKGNYADLFREVGWADYFEESWESIYKLFEQIPVSDNYRLKWGRPDKDKAVSFLCSEHDFSVERVSKTMDELLKSSGSQKGLGDFF